MAVSPSPSARRNSMRYWKPTERDGTGRCKCQKPWSQENEQITFTSIFRRERKPLSIQAVRCMCFGPCDTHQLSGDRRHIASTSTDTGSFKGGTMMFPASLIPGSYDYRLVTLSVLIAVFASYAA